MKKLIIIGGIAIVVFGVILGFAGCRTVSTGLPARVTLRYWGVWDERKDLERIISNYTKLHPHVTIEYRKFRAEEYEDELLRAWALGEGPDLFQIHNTWMAHYLDEQYLAPAPKETTAVYVTNKKNLFNQVEQEVRRETVPFYTLNDLRQQFVDVVAKDAVWRNAQQQQAIFGLPLSVDTLALYYNEGLLNRANVAFPPATWQEFLDVLPRLVVRDTDGTILQAGAAIGGTSATIENAQDILALLMMQNGATMLSENNQTVQFTTKNESNQSLGELALSFYTDFANPAKTVYTWSLDQPNALDAFIQGKVAFFFGYSYHLARLSGTGEANLFHVAPFPQIDTSSFSQVTFANYWMNVVFRNSTHTSDAWNFLQFATSNVQSKYYVVSSRRPPARRDLIAEVQGDPELQVFVNQLIPSRSWYRGRNPEAAEQFFDDMVTNVVSGEMTATVALQQAAQQIQLTLQ